MTLSDSASEHFAVYYTQVINNKNQSLHVVLNDFAYHQLVIFNIKNNDMIDYDNDKSVHVIKDDQHDQNEVHKLEYILGMKLDTCEKMYVVVYNDCVIGKICFNKVTNTLRLMCKDSYAWKINVCPVVSQSPCANISNEQRTFLKHTCGLDVSFEDEEIETAPITCYKNQRIVNASITRSHSGPL